MKVILSDWKKILGIQKFFQVEGYGKNIESCGYL